MLQSCVAIAEEVPGVSVRKVFLKERPGDTGRYLSAFFGRHHVECVTYQHFSTVKEALAGMSENLDLLISVYNEDRVDEELLSRFKHKINFHPSPLPRYGGLSPESWAILAGESVHGATWHEMVPELDTGDIVSQELFTLDPGWTACDVALECTRTGCRLFKPLLIDLAHDKLTYRPQNLADRSYFGRRLLPFGGRFPFRAGYEAADRLRRATAYFPIPNPFCTPTVIMGDVVIGLIRFSVHREVDVALPGTVISINEDGVGFAMAGGILNVNLLLLPGGKCVRSTDPAALALLTLGRRAVVEDEIYDAMGLSVYRSTADADARAGTASARCAELPSLVPCVAITGNKMCDG
jgi:methionyl-tRNA formyltransferase